MLNGTFDYYLWEIKRLPLKEREVLFWKFFDLMKNEPFLVTSFRREEINQRFGAEISEDDYRYLKENPLTYEDILSDCPAVVISDYLFDRKKEAEK